MSEIMQNSLTEGVGGFLYLNEELSDVTIEVKRHGHPNPWRFPVHSLILSAQSSVFRRMLSNDFLEKTSGQIVIEDIKPTIVKRLLEYIYCGKADLENWYEAIELLRAAHKYQVEPLFQHCARFLENVITISNVCYIYNEAITYSIITLREKCLKLILDAGFVILTSKTFEILNKESVMDVVSNAELNINNELVVFEALLRWAPVECCRVGNPVTQENILQQLKPFLQFVCFDDMPDTDKSKLPGAVRSCVKPNNKNRITFHVPQTLLAHSYFLNFYIDQEFTEFIGNSLTNMRFSLDVPAYLIGISFVVLLFEFPQHMPLDIVKENQGVAAKICNINLSLSIWKESLQINERKLYEAQILFRQPYYLEEKVVYKLSTMDLSQNVQCPRTHMFNKTLYTSGGHINASLHSEIVWGVTQLIFV